MENNNNAVAKGLAYEEKVVALLKSWGLDAHRTNITNPDDPEEYKHGFDGGVDIIARYSANTNVKRDFTFYIQCKDHKTELPKSAISEVYAGMHARKNRNSLCYAVVISTCNASQETIQFAKSLGVELILPKEWSTLHYIFRTKHATYDNYGALMKIIIYHFTKDSIWIDTLPENGNPLSNVAIMERMLEQSTTDFDKAQSYLDNAADWERKANEARQKAIDIQKIAAMRAIKASGLKGSKNSKEEKTDKQDEDSG